LCPYENGQHRHFNFGITPPFHLPGRQVKLLSTIEFFNPVNPPRQGWRIFFVALFLRLQCPVKKRLFPRGVRELQRFGVRGWRHFFPGLLQRVNDFFFRGLRGEVRELMLQKNQA
jgi:hypothetical protein